MTAFAGSSSMLGCLVDATPRPDPHSALATIRAYNALPDVFSPWRVVDGLSGVTRLSAKHPEAERHLPMVLLLLEALPGAGIVGYCASDGWSQAPTMFDTEQGAKDWCDAQLRARGAVLLTEHP